MDLLEQALDGYEAIADPTPADLAWKGYGLGLMGQVAHMLGDRAQAEARLTEGVGLLRAIGGTFGLAISLTYLGAALRQKGETDRPAALFAESLGLLSHQRNPWAMIHPLLALADLAGTSGRWEPAVRRCGAVDALREYLGVPQKFVLRDPQFHAMFERVMTGARARLGEDGVAAAWVAGRALPPEQVFAEALTIAEAHADVPASPDSAETSSAGVSAEPHGLSPRELEVLRLVAEGHTDREIADALAISRRTATTHLSHILDKLGLDSRNTAAAYAVRHGLA
jgi:non-specific serine/threonine protein kinase